jgi:hypothetical protein
MADIPLIDRLSDRGFVDQWGFMAFAVIGFAAIVSAKWLNAPTSYVAGGAVLAMLVYAAIVGRSGTGRVRADQAGDNCYYLGLIYTLASLSYAIGTFDPSDTASTIVQGFGIALATTIFGLILRVFFNQGRPDLENVEEQARLELTEAAARLKGELNGVVRKMNDFSRQLQQSMEEMHGAATASMETFTKDSIAGLQSVVDTANDAIRGQANDFASRAKRYATTFDTLVEKLETHAQTVAGMTAAHDAIAQTAQIAKGTVDGAAASLEALAGTAETARVSAMLANEASLSGKALAEQLVAAAASVQASLQSARESLTSYVSETLAGSGRTVAQAMTALETASETLGSQLADFHRLHETVLTQSKVQGETSLQIAKQHNDALEVELTRSRALVAEMRTALAALTPPQPRHQSEPQANHAEIQLQPQRADLS